MFFIYTNIFVIFQASQRGDKRKPLILYNGVSFRTCQSSRLSKRNFQVLLFYFDIFFVLTDFFSKIELFSTDAYFVNLMFLLIQRL